MEVSGFVLQFFSPKMISRDLHGTLYCRGIISTKILLAIGLMHGINMNQKQTGNQLACKNVRTPGLENQPPQDLHHTPEQGYMTIASGNITFVC
jgi:hypothetical protein